MLRSYHPDDAAWNDPANGTANETATETAKKPANEPANEPATRHYDLAVHGAMQEWRRIRWALFVFPDITDVAPTDDPDVVRVFYEGSRPYPGVWTVELRQQGFDLPLV